MGTINEKGRIKNAPNVVIVFDSNGMVQKVSNNSGIRLPKYFPETFEKLGFEQVIERTSDDNKSIVKELLSEVAHSQSCSQPLCLDITLFDENKLEFGVPCYGMPLPDGGYQLVLMDKAVCNLSLQFQTIFNAIHEGVLVYDNDGLFLDCNPSFLKLFGVADKEVMRHLNVNYRFDPNVSKELVTQIEEADEQTIMLRYDFDLVNTLGFLYSTNKGVLYLALRCSKYMQHGKRMGTVMVIADVTAEHNYRNQLEEYKLKTLLVTEYNHISMWNFFIDRDEIIALGRNALLNGQKMSVAKYLSYIHPSDRSLVANECNRAMNRLCSSFQFKVRCRLSDDSQEYSYVIVNGVAVRNENGVIQSYTGMRRDVTEQEKSLLSLKEYQLRMDLANEYNRVALWDYNVQNDNVVTHGKQVLNEGIGMRPEVYLSYVYPNDRMPLEQMFQKMRKCENVSFQLGYRIRLSDSAHNYVNVSLTVTPLIDNRGRIVGYTGLRKDITDDIERNRQLYMTMEIGKLVPITYMSQSDSLQITKSEIQNGELLVFRNGKSLTYNQIRDNVCPDDWEAFDKMHLDLKNGCDSVSADLRYDPNHQYHNWYNIRLKKTDQFYDGNFKAVGCMQDITSERKVIDELAEAKAAAEKSDNLKSAFLANMSHEIRTPLNAIVGFSDMLSTCDNEDEKKEFCKIISMNNTLLLRLINDILDLSRIESGTLDFHFEKFDLSALFEEIFVTLSMQEHSENVNLRKDIPYEHFYVNMDKSRVRQIEVNFLTNALKYTSKGYVKMGYCVEENSIRIYVEDTGCGIPEEYHEKVFDRFQKVNDFIQGAGLGLSICKVITEALGGTIGLDSQVDKGSRFWVLLPLDAETKYNENTK